MIFTIVHVFPVQFFHRRLAKNYELVGNGVCILAKMDLGVKIDAAYDGADQFVKNCAQSTNFGPIWGPKWAFGIFWPNKCA